MVPLPSAAPETEDEKSTIIPHDWKTREQAQMFDYKYQIMIRNKENNDICSYLYVWVDKETKTAYVEPMSTREKYRKKGFGKAMLLHAQNLLFEDGIKYCFVNKSIFLNMKSLRFFAPRLPPVTSRIFLLV